MSVSHASSAVYADFSIYYQTDDKHSPRSDVQPSIDASVQEARESLAQAQAFKKKIAKFLCAHMGKGSFKAAKIVERIPTNDPLKLENLYEVLNAVSTQTEDCKSLKSYLTWEKKLFEKALGECVCFEETTSDQRLTLRALMLYMFSIVDLTLREDENGLYISQKKSAFGIVSALRQGNYEALREGLAFARIMTTGYTTPYHQIISVPRVRVLPVVLDALTAKGMAD